MNHTQSGVLALIRGALTGKAQTLPGDFQLNDALPLIRRHQIDALAYEGALLCGISPEEPAMGRLLEDYGKLLLLSEEQRLAIQTLCQALEDQEIDYLCVKGTLLKELYPRPELRVMGDADILIRKEQYPRIIPILERLGFSFLEESDHEYDWYSSQLHLELHKRLIPSYNKDYCAYFGDGWSLAKKVRGTRYELCPEDHYIYLLTHLAKHCRSGGIGCRQVIDLWVWRQTFPEMDQDHIHRALNQLRLETFHENVCRMCGVWLEGGTADAVTDALTDFIFQSGSWGQPENKLLSTEVRNVCAAGSLRKGRLRSFFTVLFPNFTTMCQQYPFLRRLPWLLPVMWPVRWLHILLFRPASIHSRKEKWQFATDDRVSAHHQTLRDLGLDFHFQDL